MNTRKIIPLVTAVMLALSLCFGMPGRAAADCQPNGTAGNDNIACTGSDTDGVTGEQGDDTITVQSGATVNQWLAGDSFSDTDNTGSDTINIEAGAQVDTFVLGDGIMGTNNTGDDTITNNGVVTNYISGDGADGNSTTNSGNDTITNNGQVDTITGDGTNSLNNTGDDTITNNGQATWIYGDSTFGANNSGDDAITNTGTVRFGIMGDGYDNTRNNAGNDTITNSGTAGYIEGQGGNDTITNSGTVITSIDAGTGDDQVNLTGTQAQVGNDIDGGAGTDTLNFAMTTSDQAQYNDAKTVIAAGGDGQFNWGAGVIQWLNFETLLDNLVLQSAPAQNPAQPAPAQSPAEPEPVTLFSNGDIAAYRDANGTIRFSFSQITPSPTVSIPSETVAGAAAGEILYHLSADGTNIFVIAQGNGQVVVEIYNQADGTLLDRYVVTL